MLDFRFVVSRVISFQSYSRPALSWPRMWPHTKYNRRLFSHAIAFRIAALLDPANSIRFLKFCLLCSFYYFVPGRGVSIAISVSVCLSARVMACLKNHTPEFQQIFCTYCLWPWLGSPLTAMQYVMYFLYFRFCG